MNESIYINKKIPNYNKSETEDGEIKEGLAAETKRKEDEIENYFLNINKLGEDLRCSCCGDVYSDPVKLKCQHLIDRSCAVIKKSDTSIKCPICHHITICEDVDELQTDFNKASQMPLKPESLIEIINKRGGHLMKLNREIRNDLNDINEDSSVQSVKSRDRKKKSRWDRIDDSLKSSFTDAIMDILSSQNSSRNITMSQFKKFNEISNKSSIMSLLTKAVLQNVDDTVNKKKCKISDAYSDEDILNMMSPDNLDELFNLEKIQFILLYREALDNGAIRPESTNKLSRSPLRPMPLSLITDNNNKSKLKTVLSPESPGKDCSSKLYEDNSSHTSLNKESSPNSYKEESVYKSSKSCEDSSPKLRNKEDSPKSYKEGSSQKSLKSFKDSSPKLRNKEDSPKSYKEDYSQKSPKSFKDTSPILRNIEDSPKSYKEDSSQKSSKSLKDSSKSFWKKDYSPKSYKEDSSQKSLKTFKDTSPRYRNRNYSSKYYKEDSSQKSPKSFKDTSPRFRNRDYSPKYRREDSLQRSQKYYKEDSSQRILKRKYSPIFRKHYSPKYNREVSSQKFIKRDLSPKSQRFYKRNHSPIFSRDRSPLTPQRDYSPKYHRENTSQRFYKRNYSPISFRNDRSPRISRRITSSRLVYKDPSPKSLKRNASPKSPKIEPLSKYSKNDTLPMYSSTSFTTNSSPRFQKEENLSRFSGDLSPKSNINIPSQRVPGKCPSPGSSDSDCCDKISRTYSNESNKSNFQEIVRENVTKLDKVAMLEDIEVSKLRNSLFDSKDAKVDNCKITDVTIVDESLQYRESVTKLHLIYSNMYHASLKMKELEHQMKSNEYQIAYKVYTDNYDEYHKLYASLQAVGNIESIDTKKSESQKTCPPNTDILVSDVTLHVSCQEQASSTISPGGYAPDSTESLTDVNKYNEEDGELLVDNDVKLAMSKDVINNKNHTPEVKQDKEKCGYLWISNLGKDTHTNDLCQLFEKYGHVSKIKLFQYKAHTPMTYFGLIFMPNVTEAETAYRELHNTTQFDRPLHIKMLDSDPLSNDESRVCV